jgi:hypothetical protein
MTGIDSYLVATMPKTCSGDLTEHVVDAVASGASRREAAELVAIAYEHHDRSPL